MKNDENKNKSWHGQKVPCLLEKPLARGAQKMTIVGN